ncbi:hypothetical protein DAPPUDRAFT_109816 [Daphnia pulex]|uniref:Uncharacterized protein n=1 Tax=Daphnia pulex TaxID=6669 RepID=E9H4A6_DAPPU|nr:hypothetical protein DAPPUDRAFT_109816 [Daphnia pulex]|eukprot:EFX73347.1 hypothetical protein DAPPUDRAFT_109816 [Daphnia pulex]
MPVCDCNKAKTRGILDVNRPYYCQPNKAATQHHRRFDTNYTLVTKQKPTTTWKGWFCKQWIKSKKIVGSFWIASYDTTYNQETHLVTPLECWEMVNNRKCGENAMQSGATSLSFTSSPVGEGKWYATREYHVLNCLAEEITLRQDTQEGPIESPFGMLNATQADRQFNHNHNTIVWGELKQTDAGTTPLLHGMAYVELTQTDEKNNISRLIDNKRQIKITFFNNPDASETKHPIFPVEGMPKTFLLFPSDTNKILFRIYSYRIILPCKNSNNTKSALCRTLLKENEWKESHEHRIRNQGQEILTAQQWVFEQINVNLDITENFPDTTLDEMETYRLEQRRAVTTTINSPIFGGLLKVNQGQGNIVWDLINWGLLQTGEDKNKKCVTYHGLGNPNLGNV